MELDKLEYYYSEGEKFIKIEILRKGLEGLVKKSEIIRGNNQKYFYENDLHALEGLQTRHNFKLANLKELEEPEISIKFVGKELVDRKREVQFIIYDLSHRRSARFAYAAIKLLDEN